MDSPAIGPVRAIDIPSLDGTAAIQQWFFTPELMNQFLCALKMSVYAHEDGSIRNQDGEFVGLWYHSLFTIKYPAEGGGPVS